MKFVNKSYYELLDITSSSSEEDVKQAYRMVRGTWTPDSIAVYSLYTPEESDAIAHKLEEAFHILSDPEQRAAYDRYQEYSRQLPSPQLKPNQFWDVIHGIEIPTQQQELLEDVTDLLAESNLEDEEVRLEAAGAGTSYEVWTEAAADSLKSDTLADGYAEDGRTRMEDEGGRAANGRAADGRAANGRAANSRAANGRAANSRAANGRAANSPPANASVVGGKAVFAGNASAAGIGGAPAGPSIHVGSAVPGPQTRAAALPVPVRSSTDESRTRLYSGGGIPAAPAAPPTRGKRLWTPPPGRRTSETGSATSPSSSETRTGASEDAHSRLPTAITREKGVSTPAEPVVTSRAVPVSQPKSSRALEQPGPTVSSGWSRHRVRASRKLRVIPDRPISEEALAEAEAQHGLTGQYLKVIRESKGITLEDISERTKVQRSYLRALEEDRYKDLPPSVYVEGFVTQVSELLKLDVDRVVTGYMARYESVLGSESDGT